jgi:cation transport protein ChaC
MQQHCLYHSISEEQELELHSQDLWIFGYGSLIWKVDFDVCNSFPAYIKGFERRFAQRSEDHRGTVEKPGRVVTLIETGVEEHVVFGMCYCIEKDKVAKVLEHLDYREKNGYSRHYIDVYHSHTRDKHPIPVLLYIGTQHSPQFVPTDEESIESIAEIIALSEGPSGKNAEYLFNLANALREMDVLHNDPHVLELEMSVKKRLEEMK